MQTRINLKQCHLDERRVFRREFFLSFTFNLKIWKHCEVYGTSPHRSISKHIKDNKGQWTAITELQRANCTWPTWFLSVRTEQPLWIMELVGRKHWKKFFFFLVELLTKSPCSQIGCGWAGCVNCRVDEKLAVQIRIEASSSKSNRQPVWGTVSQETILRLMNQLNESTNFCQWCEWLFRTNLQYVKNDRRGNIWLFEVRATIQKERWREGDHKLHEIQQRQIASSYTLGCNNNMQLQQLWRWRQGPGRWHTHDNICFALGNLKVDKMLQSMIAEYRK